MCAYSKPTAQTRNVDRPPGGREIAVDVNAAPRMLLKRPAFMPLRHQASSFYPFNEILPANSRIFLLFILLLLAVLLLPLPKERPSGKGFRYRRALVNRANEKTLLLLLPLLPPVKKSGRSGNGNAVEKEWCSEEWAATASGVFGGRKNGNWLALAPLIEGGANVGTYPELRAAS